jgi:hypothetical protein
MRCQGRIGSGWPINSLFRFPQGTSRAPDSNMRQSVRPRLGDDPRALFNLLPKSSHHFQRGSSMSPLLMMIGAWFTLNAFLVVAAFNDKLRSWVSYLFSASMVVGLAISGTILMLP